jgi:DNA processing protein
MTPLLRVLLLLSASGGSPRGLWDAAARQNVDPGRFLEGGVPLWESLGYSPSVIKRLAGLSSGQWPEEEEAAAKRNGVRLLPFSHGDFPKQLAGLPGGPVLLYVRGEWPLDGPSVAVVGTRRCSAYGKQVAAGVGRAAAGAGAVLISGGAAGIDGAAHEGCLDGGGVTAAVLGTGVDIFYPGGHEDLFRRILDCGGALVSEYPFGTPPRKWNFPERNRIIAGMADRLVVVEAPHRSGAMSTARHALEAGKEVWAVPGRITEECCGGSNRLIFDGAHPLVSISEFAALAFNRQLSLFPEEEKRKKTPFYTEKEQKILSVLKKHGERTVDNMAVECTMSPADVLSSLAVLAAAGRVFPSGPGRWSATPE